MSEIRMLEPGLGMDRAQFDELQKQIARQLTQMRLPDSIFNPTPASVQPMNRVRMIESIRTLNARMESASRKLSEQIMPVIQNTVRSLYGMSITVSESLPRHRELIGHRFNSDITPSKNRSKRQWKKLRYGTRKNSRVTPMYRETEQMFILPGGNAVVSPEVMKQMGLLRGL